VTDRNWYCRRPVYGALLVVLIATAFPVSQSLGSASSRAVTVPIQRNNGSCHYGTHKAIGKATFVRNKDGSLTIRYSLHGAAPTRTYYVRLFSDAPIACFQVVAERLGKFKVDASGDGSKTFVVKATDMSGYNDFWLLADNVDANSQDRSDVAHV
jgi:hypothetical protein